MTSIYAKPCGNVQSLFAMTAPLLRIATRGSPLALAQARLVQTALARFHDWQQNDLDTLCPIIAVKTSGDKFQDRPLSEAGGKGLFVKEVQEALLQSNADIAVHALKDLPAEVPPGLFVAAVLPREAPCDVFVAANFLPFKSLKHGARLGTSSPRRRAQALRLRPDLHIVNFRGNVETRLAKLVRGDVDGTVLALAGLTRLSLTPPGAERLNWMPALCQGAIGVEIRAEDRRVHDLVAQITDRESAAAIACERGFLSSLEGSCRTPIAGLAEYALGKLVFRGEVLALDGSKCWNAERDITVEVDDLESLAHIGRGAAEEILEKSGKDFPKA